MIMLKWPESILQIFQNLYISYSRINVLKDDYVDKLSQTSHFKLKQKVELICVVMNDITLELCHSHTCTSKTLSL